MSESGIEAETHGAHGRSPEGFRIRPAGEKDVRAMAQLLVRLKRLNEEFDPLLKVREDAEEQAVRLFTQGLEEPSSVILVVEGHGTERGKIVGVSRALVRERLFYQPKTEGVILDIYLLPAYRRLHVGEQLLKETVRLLKEKGAGIVTAEFPSQNQIAVRFYAKRGFRPVVATHAKEL
jgi:ribosomal protein S18 acetylase RimI-like enzyme